MAKIIKPLTDIQLKRTKPKEKDYTLSDGNGLQLLVKSNGRKLWEFYYKSPTKFKRRKTSFGNYPQVSLIFAREKAQRYRDLISQGIDPIDHFRALEQEKDKKIKGEFKKVAREWLKKRKGELSPRTFEKINGLFENFIIPPLQDKSIKDIMRKDIAILIEAKAKQAPETAGRMYQYLNQLWLYSINLEYCEHNIISTIDRKSLIPKRQRIHYPKITELKILKELVNSIYNYNGHYSVRNALRFVLHIPLRPKNLVNLRWDMINLENQTLTIPREEMKDTNPNLPDFIMPLTSAVMEILQEQKFFTGHQTYIFTSAPDKDIPINPETPNRALERMGFNDLKSGRRQRLHSFRGTFRSLAETYTNEHKASEAIKEAVLDHRIGNTVRNAYTNKAQYLEQLKPLMKWWSDFIESLLNEGIKR